MDEKKNLFREKSMKRAASPENLNEYLHVTGLSVWLILAAILILLLGFLVWAVFGNVTVKDAAGMETSVHPITYILN